MNDTMWTDIGVELCAVRKIMRTERRKQGFASQVTMKRFHTAMARAQAQLLIDDVKNGVPGAVFRATGE